jgi:hypothetical protein
MNRAPPQLACSAPKVEAAARPLDAQRTAARARGGVAPAYPSEIATDAGGERLPGHLKRAWPGFDFSRVVIDASPQAAARADALGVPAFAEGRGIGFAAGQFAPATSHGQQILAHEMAHVVQQELGLPAVRGADRAGLERDAERDARAAASGRHLSIPTRAGSAVAVAQGFDPTYHEEATIGGLTGIFTPGEIGRVYEGNWKRDFSQGWPEIADIVIAWKELKAYDQSYHQTNMALQAKFMAATGALLMIPNQTVIHNVTETYGGYRYWEHMDNPGAAAADADMRWGTRPGDMPGYIRDSRASLKDKLREAIFAARDSWGGLKPDSGRAAANVWARGPLPATYDIQDPFKDRARPPQEFNVAKSVPDAGKSSSQIAYDVQEIAAKDPNATAKKTKGFGLGPEVADNLGRASHLIEDFFAHSNFVELATALQPGQTIPESSLKTGTFEAPDKLHSLSGKLRDAADDMDANKRLLPPGGSAVIASLRRLAQLAEQASQALGPKPDSHTKLAKDNPHAGPNFPLALRLATVADQMVFFYVHKIMEEKSPDRAQSQIDTLYQIVDAIITVPSDHHPLRSVFRP